MRELFADSFAMRAFHAIAWVVFSLHIAHGAEDSLERAGIEANSKAYDSPESKAYWEAQSNALETGDLQPLLKAAQNFVRAYPEFAPSYGLLGSSYQQMGFDDDDAIRAYQKAVKLDPGNAGFWASLGDLYKRKQDTMQSITVYRQAIALYRKQLEQAPTGFSKAETLSSLAALYLKVSRKEEARQAYQDALKENAHATRAWMGLGNMFADEGKEDQAIDAYYNIGKKYGLHRAWELLKGRYIDTGKDADATRCDKKAKELKAQGM